MLWVYYSSFILFFGAEFTKVWSLRHLGDRVVPEENAVKVTEEDRARQGIPSEARMAEALAAQPPAGQVRVGRGSEGGAGRLARWRRAGSGAWAFAAGGALAGVVAGIVLGGFGRGTCSDDSTAARRTGGGSISPGRPGGPCGATFRIVRRQTMRGGCAAPYRGRDGERKKFMIVRLVCVFAALGFVAPVGPGPTRAPPKAAGITAITLTRTGDGKGAGPEDVLTLRGDGTAAYVGRKNVERIGSYSGKVPAHGFEPSFPLLARMYESLRGKPHSTGKPTETVTAVYCKVVRDGKAEEIGDLCPGIDPALWAFEMAVRGVAGDVGWKEVAWGDDTEGPVPASGWRKAPGSARTPSP